jgi:hypothetical protein
MTQVEYYSAESRSWWERFFSQLMGRSESDSAELPPDSLFSNAWDRSVGSVADVPEQVKAQIREEAVLDAFNRLESSLRLLLHATTPGKEPPSPERLQQILSVWRYELEHRVKLTPDTYCGAIQRYDADMDAAYAIDARCQEGDLLRIRVPCWRMFNHVVIRGEAELVDGAEPAAIPVAVAEWEAPSEPVG